MPDIYLIGKDVCGRSLDDLKKLGDFTSFKSINRISGVSSNHALLIVVDRDQCREPSFRDFCRAFSDVPKLVVAPDDSFRGFGPWLRIPLTFHAKCADDRELVFLAKKLIAEHDLRREKSLLEKELGRARYKLGLFDSIGKVLTSGIDLNIVLSKVMRLVKQALGAASWSIFILDDETGEVALETTDDVRKKPRMLRLKPGEGIAGWVLKEGMPLIVPDVSRDRRFQQWSVRGKRKAHTIICVPVKCEGKTVGVIEFTDKAGGGPFTRDDLDLVLSVVDFASVAAQVSSLSQRMAELSVTDDLTKLFNSRYLNRTIEVELQRSERARTSVSLIFMDIDYFKQVNDNYGHLVGSKVLVEVGQLLLKSLRSIDIVARYGGDEFVIVLPQTTPEVAARVAERIRRNLEQNSFLKREGSTIRLTASFGVASYPESAKTKDELLRRADEAMYRVKNYTKNGVYAII